MSLPPQRKSGYLPGLDGLRALAILGVIATHDLPWSLAGHTNVHWKDYGGWGVELFFAISGVLICWRLLEDEAKAGKVRLGAFYVRRLFRIQPAAFVYLAAIAVLGLASIVPFNWMFWSSAVCSYTNFVITARTPPGPAAFVGHFWTLSVEEHFYILISAVFLLARKRRTLLLGALFGALVLAQTYAESHGRYSVLVERRTYWTIQFLLFPSLLALVVRRAPVRRLVVAYGQPWVATLLIGAGMWLRILWRGRAVSLALVRHLTLTGYINASRNVFFYGLGVWVVAIMLHPESLSTRLLEWRPLRLLGRLSYSLYLWHVLFFSPVYLPGQIHSRLLMALAGRPWKYMATATAALLSYYLVEKPMIRLGHRIAPPATAGHGDLSASDPAPEPALIATGASV